MSANKGGNNKNSNILWQGNSLSTISWSAFIFRFFGAFPPLQLSLACDYFFFPYYFSTFVSRSVSLNYYVFDESLLLNNLVCARGCQQVVEHPHVTKRRR